MGQVISLKSGKKLGGNNYKENDELAGKKGEYHRAASFKSC